MQMLPLNDLVVLRNKFMSEKDKLEDELLRLADDGGSDSYILGALNAIDDFILEIQDLIDRHKHLNPR